MPNYEYDCDKCGTFTQSRPIAERNDPLGCPDCGALATRVIITAPAYAGMPATTRLAYATNERSAHEPRSSKQHGAGCACCSAGHKSSIALPPGTPKSFPDKRPWMISH
jgi:putative FmdB family regulatory protein